MDQEDDQPRDLSSRRQNFVGYTEVWQRLKSSPAFKVPDGTERVFRDVLHRLDEASREGGVKQR
ncbi:hypothetical protein GGD50_006646 [Rhizobium paranaense]|uniref:Uncharacterized protein n=1 Tax=Rhizobium paranaense TaxID=1650438 RepID=A0A7W8XYN7_9HYPH|nr:hypothetical protein [Rhizobium paranaense]